VRVNKTHLSLRRVRGAMGGRGKEEEEEEGGVVRTLCVRRVVGSKDDWLAWLNSGSRLNSVSLSVPVD
jgi:hypothetical protein